MGTITAKELHLKTRAVLDQSEDGESMLITRNGHPIGRLEPIKGPVIPAWSEIMAEVWHAQKRVKRSERVRNPILAERQRRRR